MGRFWQFIDSFINKVKAFFEYFEYYRDKTGDDPMAAKYPAQKKPLILI
ncbi:MAG: hypothetical protein PHF82_09215 [Lutispora sp.]|nr:hypothetical protein [Lutispora sp.]